MDIQFDVAEVEKLKEEVKNYTYLYYNKRCEAHSGYSYGTTEDIKTFDEAVTSLFKYELGFGGRVQSVSRTHIQIRTHVLAKIDYVTFTSSEKEMAPLLALLRCYMEAKQALTSDELMDGLEERMGKLARVPFFVVHGGPIIQGQLVVKKMLEMFGEKEIT